jgi:hypothetical protein
LILSAIYHKTEKCFGISYSELGLRLRRKQRKQQELFEEPKCTAWCRGSLMNWDECWVVKLSNMKGGSFLRRVFSIC